MGYRYDSSNIDDDAPYSLTKEISLGPDLKPVAAAKGMVELPFSLGLQDSYHFTHHIFIGRCQTFMLDALRGLLTHGNGWACVSLHPRADMGIARQVEMPILDTLVKTIHSQGARLQLCKDVAAPLLQSSGNVLWNGKERV